MSIQGQPVEVTVVCCSKLKDTEWISRQDPYVCLEYASSKFRTRTCTDGGKNPVFQEKFVFPLIEGLRELNVVVWNSNTLTFDDFIGSGKVQLSKVLSQGFDDSSWPLQSKSGRYAGELKLILHFPNAASKLNNHQKPAGSSSSYMTTPTPTAPPPSYYQQQQQQPSPYYHHPPPPPIANAYPPPPANSPYPPPYSYPPSSPYPPQPYPPPQSYPPSSAYPPPSYPPPAGYPPQTHGGIYPPPPPY